MLTEALTYGGQVRALGLPDTETTPRARRRFTDGFTLAELLVVLAIIAILLSLASIAVASYLKDLSLTKYDSAAKQIYLAAQNNVSDLEASGEWVVNKDGIFTPVTQATDSVHADQGSAADSYTYYYVTTATAQNDGILPSGTIDADVWAGSYVIEYCYETGMVYGVFYTDEAGAAGQYYANNHASSGFRDRSARRANDPVVGYYGGASADSLSDIVLAKPEVKMVGTVVTVRDSNLDGNGPLSGSAGTDWKTYQMLTITCRETGERLILRLSTTDGMTPQVQAYHALSASSTPTAVTLSSTDFCTLVASGGSVVADTYSIDVSALASDPALALGFTDGKVLDLTSRCSSASFICRSAYGYAQGLWTSASEDLCFTSNALSDWESTATIDAYVNSYNKLTIQNGYQGKGSTKGNQIELEFSNFYDDSTFSQNPLCYTIALSRADGTALGSDEFYVSNVSTTQPQGTVSGKDTNTYHYFAQTKQTHYVTLAFAADEFSDAFTDDEGVDYRGYVVTVTAYRYTGSTVDTSASRTLTINLHVHKSTGQNRYYIVDSAGSSVATLYVLSDNGFTPTVEWNTDSLVIDATSIYVPSYERDNDGSATLNAISAQGSMALRFIKLDTSANYSTQGGATVPETIAGDTISVG